MKLILFICVIQSFTLFSQKKIAFAPFAPKMNDTLLSSNKLWVNTGMNILIHNKRSGFVALSANIHYLTKRKRHIEVRGMTYQDFAIFDEPKNKFKEISLLHSYLLRKKNTAVEIGFGVSGIFGYSKGALKYYENDSFFGSSYYRDKVKTLGFPVELKIYSARRKIIGLVTTIKGNLNPQISYGSLGFELQFNSPYKNKRRITTFYPTRFSRNQ